GEALQVRNAGDGNAAAPAHQEVHPRILEQRPCASQEHLEHVLGRHGDAALGRHPPEASAAAVEAGDRGWVHSCPVAVRTGRARMLPPWRGNLLVARYATTRANAIRSPPSVSDWPVSSSKRGLHGSVAFPESRRCFVTCEKQCIRSSVLS